MAPGGREQVSVYLDAEELGPPALVGLLGHESRRGRSVLSFEYEPSWLHGDAVFMLDPRLNLYEGPQYPATAEQFGIFLDSAPDRWGRLLMERREAANAQAEARPARSLTHWDYLLGVHDRTRLGALRFRRAEDGAFVDDSEPAVPPIARLRELEHAARVVEQPEAERADGYLEQLALLVAPGSSLGGARPKASCTDEDGSLWMAKFPARQDRRDVAAWEFLVHRLAQDAGIVVPEARLLPLSDPHRTFCVKRFDRRGPEPEARRMFVSAMTMLERQDGDGASYLDLAQLIQDHGASGSIAEDLEQLFRRVVFSVMVGNRDDHLRNHGFVRVKDGWRLSPAFDMNPTPDQGEHALSLDADSARPDVARVLATSEFYRLGSMQARTIAREIAQVVRSWPDRARALDLGSPEVAFMAPAFALAKGASA